MRLQNIIDSIRPAVMAKVESVIAKHEKIISDKEADVTDKQNMSWRTEGDLLLQLESARIMSERNCSDNSLAEHLREHNNGCRAAMQGVGSLGLSGGSLGRLLGDCL